MRPPFVFPAKPVIYLKTKPRKLHKSYHNLLHKTGWSSSVPFGFRTIVVSDPQLVKSVLSTLPKSDRFYDWLTEPVENARFLGQGMLTSSGPEWKSQRKALDAAFVRKEIESSIPLMKQETRDVIASTNCDEVVNITTMCSAITLNIVSNVLFGETFDDNAKSKVVTHVAKVNDEIMKFLNPLYIPVTYSPSYVQSMLHSTIEVRKQVECALDKRLQSDVECNDLLSLIIDYSSCKEEMIDQVLTFFLAGYDTSATTIMWALYLLHMHENKKYLGNIMMELEYCNESQTLKNVILETLRLYPASGGGFIRKFTVENKDNENFPSSWPINCDIVVPVYSMHRHPDHWSEPDEFMPERWETISEAQMANVYMPFSQGPRNCIGKYFAMSEITAVVSTLLTEVEFYNTSQCLETELTPVMTSVTPFTAILNK